MFEVPQLIQLLCSRAPLTSILLFVGKNQGANIPELRILWTTFVALLVTSRLAVVAYPHNSGVLRTAAAVHAVELPCLATLFVKNVLPAHSKLPLRSRVMIDVIMGFVVANPIIFVAISTL